MNKKQQLSKGYILYTGRTYNRYNINLYDLTSQKHETLISLLNEEIGEIKKDYLLLEISKAIGDRIMPKQDDILSDIWDLFAMWLNLYDRKNEIFLNCRNRNQREQIRAPYRTAFYEASPNETFNSIINFAQQMKIER